MQAADISFQKKTSALFLQLLAGNDCAGGKSQDQHSCQKICFAHHRGIPKCVNFLWQQEMLQHDMMKSQSEHLAAGLSILLTTTMTFFSMSRALRRTNLVCGIGPSTESTRSSTPAHHHTNQSLNMHISKDLKGPWGAQKLFSIPSALRSIGAAQARLQHRPFCSVDQQ